MPIFDVPDFMHVEGTYTTNMNTKAYSKLSDYTRAKSQFSNTKKGDTSFKEETKKLRNKYSEGEDIGGTLKAGMEGMIGFGFESKKSEFLAENTANSSFSSERTVNLADYLTDKKSKENNEREVMISELSIEISRYRAFLDDSSVGIGSKSGKIGPI